MGQAWLGIVKALECESCARYVCNAMTLHSKCSDCCELDVHTDEVEVQEEQNLGALLGSCLKQVKDDAQEEPPGGGD